MKDSAVDWEKLIVMIVTFFIFPPAVLLFWRPARLALLCMLAFAFAMNYMIGRTL